MVAVLTLALGIGANTAIFSVVNAILFNPFPVGTPERLADVYGFKPDKVLEGFAISFPDYQDIRDQAKSFEGLAAVTPPQLLAIAQERESVLAPAQLVTGNYFDIPG